MMSEEQRRASIVALTKNTSAEIKNPLVGIPKSDLFRNVENYAGAHGLTDILPLLKKGALVAQKPDQVDSIEELDADEVRVVSVP